LLQLIVGARSTGDPFVDRRLSQKPPFSDAEEEQLVSVLELQNITQVRAVVSAASFVFEQAIYYQLTSQALDAQLEKVQMIRNLVRLNCRQMLMASNAVYLC
jgi:hypothetical protein